MCVGRDGIERRGNVFRSGTGQTWSTRSMARELWSKQRVGAEMTPTMVKIVLTGCPPGTLEA